MDGSTTVLDLFRNVSFWSPFFAWMAAQTIKMCCAFYRTRRIDFSYLVSTGGMPSAHASLVWGLTTSVGINGGFDSPFFATTLALALIVSFDATTVRNAMGQQAHLLNEMMRELFKEHHFSEKKLKELLGHTPFEVFVGMVVGILTALLVNAVAVLT